MINNTNFNDLFTAPVRHIEGKAKPYRKSRAKKAGATVTINGVAPIQGALDVQVTSKNLLPKATAANATINGVTFTINEDGTITANGTATGDITYNLYGGWMPHTCQASYYWFSCCPVNGSRTTYRVNFAARGANGTKIIDDLETGAGFAVAATAMPIAEVYCTLRIAPNTVCDNLTFKPQLELGATATAYAPHIADFSNVIITREGGNLYFNNATIEKNIDGFKVGLTAEKSTFTLDGVMGKEYATEVSRDIPLKAGTYIISVEGLNKLNSSHDRIYIRDCGTNTIYANYIQTGTPKTFTLSSDTKLSVMLILAAGSTYNNATCSIQIERNPIKTAHKPYMKPQEYYIGADGKPLTPIYSAMPSCVFSTNNVGAALSISYSVFNNIAPYTSNDVLKSFTIERVGDQSKFFGFGVCQKANIKLITSPAITTDYSFDIAYMNGADELAPYPRFYVTECHKDENSGGVSVTAYDRLYNTTEHSVAELGLQPPYNVRKVAEAVAAFLGVSLSIVNVGAAETCFDTEYTEGANFEGTETLQEVLNAIAEVTQTIYYLDNAGALVFKRLGAAVVTTIDKAQYITLESKDNKRLASVVSATELGENVGASLSLTGSTQYVRNNPFWDLRLYDIEVLVEKALAAVGGFTLAQFDCSWRGNPLLEIGDKIELVTKDNSKIASFVLDDVIEYNGALSGRTQWNYTDNGNESEHNATTLGDVLRQTYAKVDKANKEIAIVAGEKDALSSKVSAIEQNTESINASVTSIETKQNEQTGAIETLTESVAACIKKDEISFVISQELSEGNVDVTADKIVTETGFVFDNTGLEISKSDSTINTKITENGMEVRDKSRVMLSADSNGVETTNLHANTYLIIGNNSRLEDYKNKRTACFWIGG